MSPSAALLLIKTFGRPVYQGSYLQVKYRLSCTKELREKLEALQKKYPKELHIHRTLKEKLIFGGTFSTSSNILYELQLVMSRK